MIEVSERPVSMIDLADVAAGQWGMITTAQARAVGHTPQTLSRLTSRGALERLAHGVYRITGVPAGPSDAVRSSWLALDPTHTAAERLRSTTPDVVSHRSAAVLQHLGDVAADRVEFTAPRRRQTRRPDVRLHRAQLRPENWTIIDGLPVTRPVQTIIDLARSHLDGGHLAGVIRDALVTYHIDSDEVAAALRPHAHMYGAPFGDGSALLQAFITGAGIPKTMIQVAELAGGAYAVQTSVRAHQEIENREIEETLAAIAPLRDRLRALYDAASHPILRSEQLCAIQERLKRIAPLQERVGELREMAGWLALIQEQIRALQEALDPVTNLQERGATGAALALGDTKGL
jgi:hypothetical protein